MICDWCLTEMIGVTGSDYDHYYICPSCAYRTPSTRVNVYEKEDEEVFLNGQTFKF